MKTQTKNEMLYVAPTLHVVELQLEDVCLVTSSTGQTEPSEPTPKGIVVESLNRVIL